MAERLNKLIAASGVASRRKADQLIRDGKVTINGAKATVGQTAEISDTVTVNGAIIYAARQVIYALYKPRGVVSSSAKQGSDKIITECVPKTPTVYPVGRLDKESEGLILLTNNGELADKLTHPRYEHTKVYEVHGINKGGLDEKAICKQLLDGVKLEDGLAKADKAIIKSSKNDTLVLAITVHEGRHHLIRRMCAALDITVERLIRTSISQLGLGNLKPGEYRILSESDLKLLA